MVRLGRRYRAARLPERKAQASEANQHHRPRWGLRNAGSDDRNIIEDPFTSVSCRSNFYGIHASARETEGKGLEAVSRNAEGRYTGATYEKQKSRVRITRCYYRGYTLIEERRGVSCSCNVRKIWLSSALGN